MRVLVIGASGLVGGNCLRLFDSKKYVTKGTHFQFHTSTTEYLNTINLDDRENEGVLAFQPDVIIHCGALTNVDYCELNENESYSKTFISAQNVCKLAKEKKAKLIYISTDYVFDGKSGPYIESDKVNPLNIYGSHKLMAEKFISEQIPESLIVRITNVYGNEIRNKNFISRVVQNIQNNQQIEMLLPYDQFATPINAYDVARCIDLLIEKDAKGIYHLGSTDYCSRVQLFQKIISYYPSFRNYKVQFTSTFELKQAAERPLLGGLLAAKFLKEFPEFAFSNVDDYLKNNN